MKEKTTFFKGRIAIIQMLFLFLSLASQAIAQQRNQDNISLNLKNVSLIEAFKSVEKKSDYKFYFNNDIVPTNKQANISVTNATLNQVLDKILIGTGLNWKLVDDKMVVISFAGEDTPPNETVITGNVKDPDKQPLQGASITEKGTTNAVITDAKGNYRIKTSSDNPVLVINFTGYVTQEIAVENKSVIDINMAVNSTSLTDVVVIGYGTQKKVSVTGAISSVSGNDLKAVPVPAISNSLAGRLSGVISTNGSGEPGNDDAGILIRGLSTLGNNSPLVVVDGVADRLGGFSRLDANDIESITVLKDASAAIYGARAANGVILVTTKRGTTGKPTVNYTFNYGLRQPTRLPKMLDAPTYAMAFNEIEQTVYNRPPRYSAADIQKFRDGSDPYNYPNTNWYDETLKSVSGQYQQNVSVSGGSDRVKYFVSIGNQYQDGYYKNGATNFKQYNIRSNIDAQVTDNLKVFVNLSGRQEDRNYPHDGSETVFLYTVGGVPTAPAYIPGTNLPGPPLGGDANPVAMVTDQAGYQKDKRTILNGDLGFTLDMPYITKGLSVIGGVYIDKTFGFFKSFYKNHFLYTQGADGKPVPHVYGPNNASLSENMSQDLAITANIRVNYARKIGDHDLTAFVAYEQYSYHNDFLSASRANFISTQIDQLFAGGNDLLKNNDGTASEFARKNLFGRVGYGYRDKYLFQFNWRRDGTTLFPANRRYGFFPGFSAGWRISQENFMQPVKFVNNLKLRASYGQLGNDRIAPFQFLALYRLSSGGVFGGGTPVLSTSVVTGVLPNPDVTWEVANTYNAGLDVQLFNNSVDLTVDYFYTKRSDILLTAANSVPDYLGLSLPSQNIARAENRGFEVTANYKRKVGAVNFLIGANVTANRSKILYIAEAANIPEYQKLTGRPIDAFINRTAGGTGNSPWLLYNAIGIFRSADELTKYPHVVNAQPGDLIFEDVNKDGIINGLDRIQQDKTSTPKLIYGIPFNVSWKGISLNMLWQGAGGVYQYVYFNSGEIGNFTQDYYDNRWTAQNPNASGPRIYDRETIASTQNINTYFYKDASYIRLKSLQLAYTLPKRLLGRLPFSNLQLYASGFNLLTFDKLKVIDPEGRPSGGTTSNYAGWYTPQTRVFNFGLNVSF